MELRRVLIPLGLILMFPIVSLGEGRFPASQIQGLAGKILPTDSCSLNCNNEESLSPELVEVYDYMHGQADGLDYGKFVPKDLAPTQDPNLVANKIADQSMQYWWNNSGAKQTPLGRNVSTVENSLKQEVDFGKANGVQQKLNFNVDAFQTQAKLRYEGYTNAEIYYQARDSSMGVQMINKIGTNKEIVLKSSSDQSNSATFRWNF